MPYTDSVKKIHVRQLTSMYMYIRAGKVSVTFDCNLNIEITAAASLQNNVRVVRKLMKCI
jgi:hypothetical protein